MVDPTGTPPVPLDIEVQDPLSRVPCWQVVFIPNFMICNLHSLSPKVDELECVMEIIGVDIACIMETWLTSEILGPQVSLMNFKLFHKDYSSLDDGLSLLNLLSKVCNCLRSSSEVLLSRQCGFMLNLFDCQGQCLPSSLVSFTTLLMQTLKDNNILYLHVQKDCLLVSLVVPRSTGLCDWGFTNPTSTNISPAVFKRISAQ